MNPTIRIAQRACEAAKARQAIVVWFDEHGKFAVASYGETKAECSAVKPVCIAIADAFDAGELPAPGDLVADNLDCRRRGGVATYREYDGLRKANDELTARAQAAEKLIETITTLGINARGRRW